MDDRLIAFLGLSLAVAVIPGPDMALVARNVLRHGRRAGVATSLGICSGVLVWALAAALGASTILLTSATAFTALKLAGAAYLVYLGIATLRTADMPMGEHPQDVTGLPLRTAWLQGVLSAVLNPKLGLFFLTLLPQFIDRGEAPTVRALQLAALFDAIGLAWLMLYTLLLGVAGTVLHRPGPQRAVRWLTGTILVGLGVRVALDRA